MSTVHERVREQNAVWWAAHPDVRGVAKGWDATSFARSVLHWHHNVESSLRHGTKGGDGSPMLAGDQFFLRQYAIDATKAWLVSSQVEIETYPPEHEHWHGYGHTDIETLIRNLQVALDDFAWNDHHG